jgi:hypothetical protein
LTQATLQLVNYDSLIFRGDKDFDVGEGTMNSMDIRHYLSVGSTARSKVGTCQMLIH